jgi:polysaccharide deacetylase family protein (PEP-CTERM system associated)
VREIQLQGHEIATHGYSHQFVYKLGPQHFRDDLLRSLEVLERIVDGPFIGHRAPFFSITKDADWAFEILAECGILYDSSVFPVHNYRYGIADAPRHFYQVHPGLMECPMSVYSNPFVNVPVGGGAYFRLFPYTFTRYGLRKINEAGHAAIFYLHPWELDPEHPRINLPRRIALTHYYNLAGTNKRLKRLLAEFHFTTMQDILKNDRID